MTPAKVALIRLDRIGDLLSTIPVDELPCFAGTSVQWWITDGLGFLLENRQPRREFRQISREFSWKNFSRLVRELRSGGIDTAIVFHAPWWVSVALFFAGVASRIGRRSQWHSFLFFNKGVRQSRSESAMHEFEYNVELVCKGLGVAIPDTRSLFARLRLANADHTPVKFKLADSYLVVHPGMSGSARNWPVENYLAMIETLSRDTEVVITGTAADEAWLKPLRSKLAQNPKVKWLDGRLSGPELISVLSRARAVVAPSTGVAHVAAATGVRTVGIYSPVRVQSPKRWAPRGPGAKALVPSVACPAIHKCLGDKCPHFDCMKLITVEDVLRALT